MSKIAIFISSLLMIVIVSLMYNKYKTEEILKKVPSPSEQIVSASENYHPAELINGLEKHCIRCHGPEKQKGKVRLDQLADGTINFDKVQLIQKSIELVSEGEMPPKKKDALNGSEKEYLLNEFQEFLTANKEAIQNESQTVYRRLNNREYLNTTADIFGFDPEYFDPTKNFPPDQRYEGINKIGSELMSSKFLSREYLIAANEIVEKTVRFDEIPKAKNYNFDLNKLSTQFKHDNAAVIWGSPYIGGSPEQGKAVILKKFSAEEDGYYQFKIRAHSKNQRHDYPTDLAYVDQDEPLRLGIKIGEFTDVKMKAVFDLESKEKWYECQIWLNKGEIPHIVYPNGIYSARAYRYRLHQVPGIYEKLGLPIEAKNKTYTQTNGQVRNYIFQNFTKVFHKVEVPKVFIKEVQVKGPVYVEWNPKSNSHLLGNQSLSENNWKEILVDIAGKLFRGPQTGESINSYISLTETQLKQGKSLEEGFKTAVKAMLCSPRFLFIEEKNPILSHQEIASRLSYFLWSSAPDENLLLASKKSALNKEGIRSQVERMLKGKKSERFINDFTSSWLKLYDLGGILPHEKLMADYYNYHIQESIQKETRLYSKYILDNNRSISEFLSSDYTVLDRHLARLYKLPQPENYAEALDFNEYKGHAPSSAFVKYNFKDSTRGGLLGHASTLMVSANGIDTSPVVRGVWVLEHLLCQSPPPVPDEVPAIEPDTRGAKSLRDRLKKHKKDENCASCHRKFDPIGFALENYDAIGKWRHKYRRHKVDPSGELNGQKFKNITGLKEILLKSKDEFAKAFTERLSSYALGRKLTFLDAEELDKIHQKFKETNYGFKDLIFLICTSELFLRK